MHSRANLCASVYAHANVCFGVFMQYQLAKINQSLFQALTSACPFFLKYCNNVELLLVSYGTIQFFV